MSFIEELKRRKVFRVAASYAVAAFIIMQLVEILFPMFNFPQWTQQFTVIIVLLGFPIAVILSWVFDKTSQGYVKTDAPESQDIGGMNVKIVNKPFYLQKRNIFLFLGVVVGILIGAYSGSAISNNVDSKSIAVLPFDNYSTAPEDQYFSDGVTEMIIANLAKVKDLKVISRTSVMEYKNTTKKIKDIAKELGVAHILEGSIQRVGDNVRIVGQLINASSDGHIWAESYDGNISELFSMQNDVAIKIAEAMKSELTSDEMARINEKLTESTDAYEYYLKGNMYDNSGHSEKNIRAAIAEYDRAVALDPNFAEAYAQLGKMHAHMKWYRIDQLPSRMEMSKKSIEMATKLKPNNAIVRSASGVYHYHGFREYGKAMSDFQFAVALEPGNASFNLYVGTIYRRLGDFEKARKSIEMAADLDPRSNLVLYNLSGTLLSLRYYNALISLLSKDKEFASEQVIIDYKIGAAFLSTGDASKAINDLKYVDFKKIRFELNYNRLARDYNRINQILSTSSEDSFEDVRLYFPREYYLGLSALSFKNKSSAINHFNSAINHLKEKIKSYPNDPRFYSTLGLTYAKLGDNKKAIAAGLKATEILPVSRDALFATNYEKQLAAIYAITGNSKKSLEKIEYLSLIPNGFHYGELKIDPNFDSIRNEPRFQTVLNNLKPKS